MKVLFIPESKCSWAEVRKYDWSDPSFQILHNAPYPEAQGYPETAIGATKFYLQKNHMAGTRSNYPEFDSFEEAKRYATTLLLMEAE